MVRKPWIIVSLCLLGAACVAQAPPTVPLAADWLAPEGTGPDATREPLYACFDAATAMRIANSPTSAPTPWTVEKFSSGFCLALPKGSRVTRQQPVRLGDQTLTKIQLQGSNLWLYVPSWSISLQQNGAAARQRASFAPLLEVTRELLIFAQKHTTCMRDVLDLNTRIRAHNALFLEENKESRGEETISKTVIKLNPSALDAKGDRLNREVTEYQARCEAYQTLEAAEPFILFMGDRAGIETLQPPAASRSTG